MDIVILEDEKVAARRLNRLVCEILGDRVSQLQCFYSFEEAEIFLSKNEIDLLLLDLNLDGTSGFKILQKVVAGSFNTIIISAVTDEAVKAFEYGVIDFIPKPYDKKRLEKALDRLDHVVVNTERPLSVLVVKKHGVLKPIQVNDILYFKGAGDYAEIHTTDGSVELHNKSLENLEKILPSRFYRVHRSFIADVSNVINLHIHGGGRYWLELQDNINIPVSRNKYKELADRLSSQL